MSTPIKESTTCEEFFDIEKLAQENLRLRKEILSLKYDLVQFKTKVQQARFEAELDSKYARGLRNYFKRGEK